MPIDVTEATFETAVLERSHRVPVVIDFWAAWCGPCRVLTPVLERVAASYAGRVELVKIDTDANPRLAMEWGIQGIPAVKAVRDGRLVGEFVGAQPEAAVRDFFDQIMALEEKRDERASILDAARAALARGELEEARTMLGRLPPDDEVSALLSDIELRRAGVSLEDPETVLAELLARVRDGDREEARERMVQVFETLGHDHPLTKRYRAELAAALF